jgi:hypothetical protein
MSRPIPPTCGTTNRPGDDQALGRSGGVVFARRRDLPPAATTGLVGMVRNGRATA